MNGSMRQDTVLTRSLSGTISGDLVSLTGGTAVLAIRNVGNGKTVTLTGASLTGTDPRAITCWTHINN